jgi:[NiFe] hydrogenase assembly HybE family chaperone
MNGFEGSFLGHSDRIDAGTRLECGVCWWVYDPAVGDEAAQVPPGTPFTALPSHWRCPGCDHPREQFMVLAEATGRKIDGDADGLAATADDLSRRRRELLRGYSAIARTMRGLPVFNECLDVRVSALQRWGDDLIGVAATPWCMNIVLLPAESADPRLEGTTRELQFPSGRYSFIAGQLPCVGALETCSLFSPMDEFDDPEVVQAVAEHALEGLFGPSTTADASATGLSRRGFLRGGKTRDEHPPN